MSDPARDGFVCCDEPMVAMVPAELELEGGELGFPCAYACLVDFKWRHALPPGHPLRPRVVEHMNNWADREYRKWREAHNGW